MHVGGVRAAGLGHPAAGGTLHATDRRAVVVSDRREPVREWSLRELSAVSALGNWGGLALVHADGNTELVVAVKPQPPTWQDAAGWLKVEGAFAAAGGRLAQWVADLPQRLTVSGQGLSGPRCATLSACPYWTCPWFRGRRRPRSTPATGR